MAMPTESMQGVGGAKGSAGVMPASGGAGKGRVVGGVGMLLGFGAGLGALFVL